MKKIVLFLIFLAVPFASLKAQGSGDVEVLLRDNCAYVCDGSLGGGVVVRVRNILEWSPKVIRIQYTLSGANTGIFIQDFAFDFTGNFGNPVDFNVTSYLATAPNFGVTTITVNNVIDTGAAYFLPITNTPNIDITLSPKPNVTGGSVSVDPLFCVGKKALVIVNMPMMPDGFVGNLRYSLSGANNLALGTTTVRFTGGIGQFYIGAQILGNVGNTTITLLDIAAGNCSNLCLVEITGVNHTFVVNPLPNITAPGGVTVGQPLCAGSNGTALLSAPLLANGTYNVKYSLSGSNVIGSTLASVVFVSGSGSLTIPGLQLSNAGGTTIQIEEIINSGNCSSVYTVFPTNTFTLSTGPNASGINTMF